MEESVLIPVSTSWFVQAMRFAMFTIICKFYVTIFYVGLSTVSINHSMLFTVRPQILYSYSGREHINKCWWMNPTLYQQPEQGFNVLAHKSTERQATLPWHIILTLGLWCYSQILNSQRQSIKNQYSC